MALSRTTSRIFTLSLLSVLLALVAYDERLQPSQAPTGLIFYNCYSCETVNSNPKCETSNPDYCGASGCPSDLVALNGKTYLRYNASVTEDQASARCADAGGRLVARTNACAQPNPGNTGSVNGFSMSVTANGQTVGQGGTIVVPKNANASVSFSCPMGGGVPQLCIPGGFVCEFSDGSGKKYPASLQGASLPLGDGGTFTLRCYITAQCPGQTIYQFDQCKGSFTASTGGNTPWQQASDSGGAGAGAGGGTGVWGDQCVAVDTSTSFICEIGEDCAATVNQTKSCSLVVAHSEGEAGLPCAALGLSNSCAQACKCPEGTWPCEELACSNSFTKAQNWISYQPNVAEGFLGAVYDRNRYLYFVPNRGDAGPHGVVWRYDTIAVLNTQPSWTVFDPSAQGLGPAAQGFAGGAFDGKYMYFAPNRNASGPSGSVMRYDTTKAMNAIGSWELFDPSTNGLGSSAKGFNGAVFDGKYVYFVPDVNGGGAHNNVMRYEVSKPFKDASSWQLFNPKSATAAKKGYGGALYDGRYVYFIPKGGGNQSTAPTADAHGEVMRYDTRGDFQSANSWTMFDPSSSGLGSNARGYHGGVFDGTYLYFAPYINGSGPHGQVLRYNTKQSFTAAASWSTFNVDTVPTEGGAKGYTGAAFDGQYVYFSPYYNGQAYHGKVARYDTKDTFTSKTAWTVFDAGTAQNVVTGTATSSAASAATLGTGGRFGIIERDDITVHPDGSITMRSGGSATVEYSCMAAINVPAGYTTNGIRCDLKNGAGQSLFPPNSDARTRNVGAFTITSTTAQTFTFSCDYTISNWISSYPHNVCSISIPVKIAP